MFSHITHIGQVAENAISQSADGVPLVDGKIADWLYFSP